MTARTSSRPESRAASVNMICDLSHARCSLRAKREYLGKNLPGTQIFFAATRRFFAATRRFCLFFCFSLRESRYAAGLFPSRDLPEILAERQGFFATWPYRRRRRACVRARGSTRKCTGTGTGYLYLFARPPVRPGNFSFVTSRNLRRHGRSGRDTHVGTTCIQPFGCSSGHWR